MKRPVIRIVNTHHSKPGEYIGRGSPLGNPYVIGEHGNRDEVIDAYAVWLKNKITVNDAKVLHELNRLANKALDEGEVALRCFCAPKRCHGEVIRDALYKAIDDYIAK